jgi:hypothetical protein
MIDVQTVIVQLRKPDAFSPGHVTTGYYVVRDGAIMMTYADGEPVYRDPEKTLTYTHQICEGDNVQAIAGVLTRQVRRELAGISEEQEAFASPLNYPRAGVA